MNDRSQWWRDFVYGEKGPEPWKWRWVKLAERVGFGLCQAPWLVQVTDSTVPELPRLPGTPYHIARCRTVAAWSTT